MKKLCRQRGFTLIEVLVTIALIAVFAVIAVPSYRALTANNQISSAVNDFANTLGAARAAAVARGETVIVCPSTNALNTKNPTCSSQTANSQQWNTGWISFVDTAGSNSFTAGDVILRVHGPLANGVTLLSSGGGGTVANYIGFNRMGFAQPTFSGATTQLVVQACAKGTGHVRGGKVTLKLAGGLSIGSGGC